MEIVQVIFWLSAFIVFYTYIGYGILLYLLVRIKEYFKKPQPLQLPDELPEVTLLIAAYNEQDVVREKMANCMLLDYPADRLHIVWVTDGSTDSTNDILASNYPSAKRLFEPPRKGKSAAVNRAMKFIKTPIVVFTDANTMVCAEALKEIVLLFTDSTVGCVSGEKRVALSSKQNATAGEGLYWKYESFLKDLDYRLYSAVGAAGELFAIRSDLYVELPHDTLLDDFVMSLEIAKRGYKIAYCKRAYAVERASEDMEQERKRKIRISAGGLQSILRLKELLNIFQYGTLSFQYISHRVLRWSITPILWFSLFFINLWLACFYGIRSIYGYLLLPHSIFYLVAAGGYLLNKRKIKNKFFFVPYYFLFMNTCVFRGVHYLTQDQGTGVWEKAQRKNG